MFINFSNHPSKEWYKKEIEEARKWGEIIDIEFPRVDAECTKEEVNELASKYFGIIKDLSPDIVMCQGEFTLTYAVVSRLMSAGIKTVAACSERISKEEKVNGVINKSSIFEFVQFREY